MELKGAYSLARNDSAPCSQLESWLELSSSVFIPLQQPTGPTHRTTLNLSTRIQTGITVKYSVRIQQKTHSVSVINTNQLLM
jgi:hypothetical protein